MALVCWWCVHALPGEPLHLPFKYDDRLKRFTTTGNFCSWECLKGYALDMNTSRSGEIQEYIALMRKHAFGKYTPLKPAPKRQALAIFGGNLTIEQFRSGEHQPTVFIPYEKYIHPMITNPGSVVTAPTVPGDDIKLKREKPLKRAESKLESSLGIIRKPK
jgi:hypothetical protein